MTATAVTQIEDLAMATAEIGAQTGSGATEWGQMDEKQRAQEVDEAVAQVLGKEIAPEAEMQQPTKPKEPEIPETPAAGDETPASDDAAEAKSPDEGETSDVSASPEWVDDETREFATMMGLNDADLAEFGSRDELDRAMRIIDRKAFEAGKAASAPSEPPKPKSDPKPLEKPAAKPTGDDPFADLTKFQLGEDFADEARAPLNAFVETAVATIKDLQDRVAHFEQQSHAQASERIRTKAVESIHSLGMPELFGKPGEKPTAEQSVNIAKAIDAHLIHANGLIASGRQVAPTPPFLKAAVHLAFGDQIVKQQRQQLAAKLQKQSSKRTGGGATKALPRAKGEVSTLEAVLADPELTQMYDKMVSEKHG